MKVVALIVYTVLLFVQLFRTQAKLVGRKKILWNAFVLDLILLAIMLSAVNKYWLATSVYAINFLMEGTSLFMLVKGKRK